MVAGEVDRARADRGAGQLDASRETQQCRRAGGGIGMPPVAKQRPAQDFEGSGLGLGMLSIHAPLTSATPAPAFLKVGNRRRGSLATQ